MKTNAIIRIIIWSLVIVVLIGILSIGLGVTKILPSRTIAASPAETWIPERVDVTTPLETEAPLSLNYKVKESTNIRATPSAAGKVLGVVEAGERVNLIDSQMLNGHHWAHISGPIQGWILLEENQDASAMDKAEVSVPFEYAVTATTNVRSQADSMAEILGAVEALQTVTVTEYQEVNGLPWGYIEAPIQGWLALIDFESEAAAPGAEAPASTAPTVIPDALPNASGAVANGYECNAAEVSEIDIDWAAGNIQILPVEGSRITIEETGDFDRHPMEIKQKNGKLSISYSDKKSIIGIHVDFSKDLTIQVPKDFLLQELDIDAASATVLIQDLTIREVEFDGASGICEFTNCSVDKLDIDTASGDIRFSGNLMELDCDAASASFIGVLNNVPSHMEMDSMSGNLDVTLPADAGFTATVEGMSSDFSSDFEATSRNGGFVHGDGRCRIQMDAMSGDVIIRKSQ